MIKYLHVGYPKNLSTTLQRDFFASTNQISHLGIGCGSNIGYIDDIVGSFFENYIRYCVNTRYIEKSDLFSHHFSKLFEAAKEKGKRAVGASCEHISFRFTSDSIDTAEKAKRLLDVFGNDTEIIIIIRNQSQLLRSLYHEGIRVGYPGTFDDYIKYVYYFQDRNFVPDFQYHHVYQLYVDLFGKSRVHVFPIEKYLEKGKLVMDGGKIKIISKLVKILGVDYPDVDLGHHNKALTPQILEKKRQLNHINRHDLGNNLWNGVENHRLDSYLKTFLNLNLPEETVFKDVIIKNDLIKRSQQLVQETSHNEIISYDCDTDLYYILLDCFQQSNQKLNQMLPNILPESYFNLLQ